MKTYRDANGNEYYLGVRLITCNKCGYTWITKAKPDRYGYISCSHCKRKIKLKENSCIIKKVYR